MSEVEFTKALPEALLKAENLPTMPAVAVEVLRLCRDEDTTLDDLAAALAGDAALSARLLRFANSSLYNFGSEVTTLQRATLVLGMKTVQLTALSFSLASSLPRAEKGAAFDYERFWLRSLVRAVTARALAHRVDAMIEDETFLAGLLAELGKMVLARCLPEEYAAVLEAAGDAWPSADLERELLGFRHSDVGAALLASWELPEVIRCSVLNAHTPDDVPGDAEPGTRTAAYVLAIATDATDLLTGESSGQALARVEAEAEQRFCMAPDEVAGFLSSLDDGVREAAEMLSVEVPAGRTFEEIVTDARNAFLQQSVEVLHEYDSVQVVSDLSHRTGILREARFRDALTGIPNRVAFDYFLDREVGARLSGFLDRPLGLLVLEVDRLSSMEATFGPEVREEVLRLVAGTLNGQIRRFDLAARMDDRLFGVILGEASPFGVRALAERLRRRVETQAIEPNGTPLRVTVTIGGACLGKVTARSDGAALVEVSRRYLQKARAKGTNRHLIHGTLLRPGRGADAG